VNRIKKFALKQALAKSKGAPSQDFIVRESTKKSKYKAVIITNSKGGVGKSTVATAIALNLAEKYKIGIFDADISSANLPTILNIPQNKQVEVKQDGTIVPLKVNSNLELYSIATFSDRHKATSIPEKGQDLFIRDASESVEWHTKRIIIDLPGGANMFKLAMKHFNVLGAMIVTMPNQLEDTNRIIDLCLHNGVQIIGLCENFSGAVWDDGNYIMNGGEHFAPFGYDSMHGLCDEFGVEHLGNIPLFQNFSLDKVRTWETVKLLTHKIQKILW